MNAHALLSYPTGRSTPSRFFQRAPAPPVTDTWLTKQTRNLHLLLQAEPAPLHPPPPPPAHPSQRPLHPLKASARCATPGGAAATQAAPAAPKRGPPGPSPMERPKANRRESVRPPRKKPGQPPMGKKKKGGESNQLGLRSKKMSEGLILTQIRSGGPRRFGDCLGDLRTWRR